MRDNRFKCQQITGLTNDSRGIALAVMAVAVAVLLAFMGLVLDGGHAYFEKRRMQGAADAGAMGGAHELWRDNTDLATQIRPASLNDTGLNGYDDGNATVTVNNPPASGPNAGDPNFVEVIIHRDIPTYFMPILNWNQVAVRARAVAGLVRYNDMCILSLDPDDRSALRTNGDPTLKANCGIMVNSYDPCAFNPINNNITSTTYIGIGGGSCGGAMVTPTPTPDVPPMMDPLWHVTPSAWMEPPPPTIATNLKITGGTVTIDPGPTGVGRFVNGIEITGGTVTFNPGIYVLDSGLKITGGTVNGAEVAFYNINSSGKDHIDISGNACVTLSAPTSGPLKGFLFYVDRNSPDKPPGNKIGRGSSCSRFIGTLYFPTQHLDWAGNADNTDSWAMVISNTIDISGTSDVSVINLPNPDQSPAIFKVTLVE